MNATRKKELLKNLENFVAVEVEAAYQNGFDAGKREGIEEGRASAAALIAGLRSLLNAVDAGKVPAELAPKVDLSRMIEKREKVEAIAKVTVIPVKVTDVKELAAGFSAGDDVVEKSEQLLEENPAVNFPGYFPLDVAVGDCQLCQGLGTIEGELYGEPCLVPCTCKAGELVKADAEHELSGGSLVETASERPPIPSREIPAEIEDVPEVAEPAAIDPVEEFDEAIQEAEREAVKADARKCEDCNGFPVCKDTGLPEKPCGAFEAAPPVETPDQAAEPEAICFRLNCKNHSTAEANGCVVFEHVFECAHQLYGNAVVCANLGCSSFESGKPANCAAIADMMVTEGVRKPATSCSAFLPAPDLAGAGTFDPTAAAAAEVATDRGEWGSESAAERENWLCCASCNIADPDCASCNLIELEIEERRAAEKAALALHDQDQPAADLPKCGNGSCTATGRGAKDVCLRISIEGRPGKSCGSFLPVDDCKHESSKRFNGEDGSLICGVCEKILQPSRRAAAAGTSPASEGVGQGAAPVSPEAARLLELQKTCKHPKVFIAAVPGRGEVCQCCDLVLTPESLPLFDQGEARREAPDAATYFAAEEGDSREGDTFREEDHQGGDDAPPACEHETCHRYPDQATGGGFLKCADCGEILKRFDAERREIPREKWPENQEAGKVVTIAEGAETRSVPFSAAEKKMIAAGFGLVCFVRPDKENIRLWVTTGDVWRLGGKYKKFVDGERALEEVLKDPKTVQVTESGNAATGKDEAKLRAVGFNFYRKERGSDGVSPKIKDGSKNWGMHSKYRSDAELEEAWRKLLTEDPFALEG